jgi:hypothetical protein
VPQTPAASAPQTAAPAVTPEPQPQTQTAQTSAGQGTPPPEPQPEPQPLQPQPAQTAAEKTDSAKAKTAKPHPNGKKPESARKTVVKENGAEPSPATGQISPGVSGTEIAHNQTTTDQLLQSTEATLSSIKRQLSQEEQAIVTQIQDYMNQSRQATKNSDLTRAYNLALKARLLSDDLAKRR